MSGFDDYPDEMPVPHPLDERSIEAFFLGRAMPDDLRLLEDFGHDVRVFAQQPAPAPRGGLAGVLVRGLTIDDGDLLIAAASNVTRPPREAARRPTWRRPRLIAPGVLSPLMTKFTALGLAAKAGVAVAVAATAVTAAGAAGTLPGPAQDVVAHVVSSVTPFHFATHAGGHATLGAPVGASAASNHGVRGASIGGAAKHPRDTTTTGTTTAGTSTAGTTTTGRTTTGTTTTGTTTTGTHSAPPASPGSKSAAGLSRAGSTPAAGHVPTSVRARTNPRSASGTATGKTGGPGSRAGAGLKGAGSTPAAGHVPTSDHAGTIPGSGSGATQPSRGRR